VPCFSKNQTKSKIMISLNKRYENNLWIYYHLLIKTPIMTRRVAIPTVYFIELPKASRIFLVTGYLNPFSKHTFDFSYWFFCYWLSLGTLQTFFEYYWRQTYHFDFASAYIWFYLSIFDLFTLDSRKQCLFQKRKQLLL